MSTELTALHYQHVGQRAEPDEDRCQKEGKQKEVVKEFWNESCGNVTLYEVKNKASKHIWMDKILRKS